MWVMIRDIEACKAIELDIISVTWGFNNEAGLRKHGATHIVDSPDAILKLLVIIRIMDSFQYFFFFFKLLWRKSKKQIQGL